MQIIKIRTFIYIISFFCVHKTDPFFFFKKKDIFVYISNTKLKLQTIYRLLFSFHTVSAIVLVLHTIYCLFWRQWKMKKKILSIKWKFAEAKWRKKEWYWKFDKFKSKSFPSILYIESNIIIYFYFFMWNVIYKVFLKHLIFYRSEKRIRKC